MNLADAIRKAAGEGAFVQAATGVPVPPPQVEVPAAPKIANFIKEPKPAEAEAEHPVENPYSAGGVPNVVRLELFMTPEQMSVMLKAILAGQHTVMTLREAASYLRIKQSTLEKLADIGDIPAVEIDGRWRFPKQHLDDWMKTHTHIRDDDVEDEDVA